MELTPKLLETQHFPERFRGYDPEAVDDFLERVAAGIERGFGHRRQLARSAEGTYLPTAHSSDRTWVEHLVREVRV